MVQIKIKKNSMKRLAIVFSILCIGVFAMLIEKDTKKSKKKKIAAL